MYTRRGSGPGITRGGCSVCEECAERLQCGPGHAVRPFAFPPLASRLRPGGVAAVSCLMVLLFFVYPSVVQYISRSALCVCAEVDPATGECVLRCAAPRLTQRAPSCRRT